MFGSSTVALLCSVEKTVFLFSLAVAMSSSESEVDVSVRKRKKGMKLVEYKSEKIKKARVKNEEYINWKNKTVSPKPHGFHCK